MRDPRIEKLADVLINHSTRIKPKETVLIASTELGQPLVEVLYQKVLALGAFPLLKLTFSTLQPLYFKNAANEQLDTLLEIEELIYKKADVLINVRAPGNMKELSSVDPDRMTRRMKTMQPIQEWVISGNLRWTLCNYPTQALAQEAEMSLDEYEDFVFGATNIDWSAQAEFLKNIKDVFDQGEKVHLVGKNTDLKFNLAGRSGIVCDGSHNMPDGEVFYAPVDDSAEGYINYDFPAIYQGREVNNVRLEFKKGQVVKASADKNEALLQKVIETDEGAKRIGEFGIGTNYGITKFTKDILFDEKIGGTIHLALGRAYPEGGGINQSAVHWDMVKDLRSSGKIYLDGKLVQENGEFKI